MSNGPQQGRPWYQRKSAAWGLATVAILFVVTWLTGKLLRWPWPDGSDWQAIWTFFTFLIAAVAASVALAQLAAHQQAQRELTRPYVVVDFAFKSILLLIEVRNIGQAPAHNVELTWNPKPQALDERHGQAIERNLVNGVIPFLAPGRTVRYSVGRAPDYWADDLMPKRYTVVARYRDPRGEPFGEDEQMVLDLGQWADALADDDYENKNWNQLKWQTEAQRKIAAAVERFDSHLEGLSESVRVRGARRKPTMRARRSRGRWTGRR